MFNILVVDDDRNTRLLLKAVLESNGYTVKTAENGVSALEIIDDIRIDMVILDIMMPQMDGYKFTEQIRSAGLEIPILMLSAKQLPEDIKKGFIAGTDDFMTKPFDDEELDELELLEAVVLSLALFTSLKFPALSLITPYTT